MKNLPHALLCRCSIAPVTGWQGGEWARWPTTHSPPYPRRPIPYLPVASEIQNEILENIARRQKNPEAALGAIVYWCLQVWVEKQISRRAAAFLVRLPRRKRLGELWPDSMAVRLFAPIIAGGSAKHSGHHTSPLTLPPDSPFIRGKSWGPRMILL